MGGLAKRALDQPVPPIAKHVEDAHWKHACICCRLQAVNKG